MLRIIARKMLKTRWMMLCLLFGVVIASAMLSSIPQYTDGILQKVLITNLENYQQQKNVYPGTYYIKGNIAWGYYTTAADIASARSEFGTMNTAAAPGRA